MGTSSLYKKELYCRIPRNQISLIVNLVSISLDNTNYFSSQNGHIRVPYGTLENPESGLVDFYYDSKRSLLWIRVLNAPSGEPKEADAAFEKIMNCLLSSELAKPGILEIGPSVGLSNVARVCIRRLTKRLYDIIGNYERNL